MRKYIKTLYSRPDHHKKQFALLASATVTLFIFGVWSLVNFGGGGVVAQSESEGQVASIESSEISPFGSLRMSVAASLASIKGIFEEIIGGTE